MKPTIESWQLDPADIGPLYPWLGSEFWLFLAALIFCSYFMYWKIHTENNHYQDDPCTLDSDISPPCNEDSPNG